MYIVDQNVVVTERKMCYLRRQWNRGTPSKGRVWSQSSLTYMLRDFFDIFCSAIAKPDIVVVLLEKQNALNVETVAGSIHYLKTY